MLDRTKAPEIRKINRLTLLQPEVHLLDNGIPVYVTNMGTQEIVKLEAVFHAGRPFERRRLAARATLNMLKEGSEAYPAEVLAETMDFYGSSIQSPFHMDHSNLTLYTLRKHFPRVIPAFADILRRPVFPEDELEQFRRRNQQRLQVDLSKPDVVAYRTFTEHLFGADHPYGYNSYPDDYRLIRREDLQEHHQAFFSARNCQLFLSGNVGTPELELLNRELGHSLPEGEAAQPRLSDVATTPSRQELPHPGSVQAAIRIGRKLFDRRHPDYRGMYVLNTVLGGYFGSRLMNNIREEKGYTYNIYSTLDTMRYDGYFYIGTEVGKDFAADTRTQIYREMDLLRKKLIPREELEMVRNYLLGNFLTMLDGPFNVSELIRTLVTEDLPLSYFDEAVESVQSIDARSLRELARKYLDPEQMWEVVVG